MSSKKTIAHHLPCCSCRQRAGPVMGAALPCTPACGSQPRMRGRPGLPSIADRRGKRQPRHHARVTAAAPGMCFDPACQAAMDKAFLTATAAPLLGLIAAVAYRLRPLEWQRRDGKEVHNAHHHPPSMFAAGGSAAAAYRLHAGSPACRYLKTQTRAWCLRRMPTGRQKRTAGGSWRSKQSRTRHGLWSRAVRGTA